MNIPVLIERRADGTYLARTGPPFDWQADGPTAEVAVRNLRDAALKFVAAGGQVAAIDVPDLFDPQAQLKATKVIPPPPIGGNPWLEIAGTLDPNDPVTQDYLQAIEDYRREVDADPNR